MPTLIHRLFVPAGIGTISCPDISREEIVNACGIDDFHDGVNYTRTACVIAGGCPPAPGVHAVGQ